MKMKNSILIFSGKICLLLSCLFLFSGCITKQHHTINVSAIMDYEGLYGANDEIIINGKKVEIGGETGVTGIWVLTDSTLYSLLKKIIDDSTTTILYGNNKKVNKTENISESEVFSSEKYVWELK